MAEKYNASVMVDEAHGIGGFIATNATIANYLRHNSRPFIFSASATPAAIGAATAALDILEQARDY